MPRKINLKLLCIDGSIIREGSKGLPFEQRVLDNNDRYLSFCIQDNMLQHFDDVILAMTDPYDIPSHDKAANAIKDAPVHALPLIQEVLAKNPDVRSKVSIDTLMLADVFQANGDGTYKTLLANASDTNEESHLLQPIAFKNSLLALQVYLYAHRAAGMHPDDNITIDFIDKDEATCDAVEAFFKAHPELLPKNVRLNPGLLFYESEHGDHFSCIDRKYSASEEIQGTGEIDNRADWSVRYLIAAEKQKIQSGDELAKIHANNEYQKRNPTLETSFGTEAFDVAAFLAFRSSNIVWLESKLEAPAYTTAEALAAEGLLPNDLLAKATSSEQPIELPLQRTQLPTSYQTTTHTLFSENQSQQFSSRSNTSFFQGIDVYVGDAMFKSSERGLFALYKRGQMTMREYLDAIPKQNNLPNHTGLEFINTLKEIAGLPKWENKGYGFTSMVIPDGIKAVREFRGREINGLASIIGKKLLGYHLSRSQATQDFYELVVAVADGRVNGTARLQAVKAFCEKHSLTEPSMIQGQRQHPSGYRL